MMSFARPDPAATFRTGGLAVWAETATPPSGNPTSASTNPRRPTPRVTIPTSGEGSLSDGSLDIPFRFRDSDGEREEAPFRCVTSVLRPKNWRVGETCPGFERGRIAGSSWRPEVTTYTRAASDRMRVRLEVRKSTNRLQNDGSGAKVEIGWEAGILYRGFQKHQQRRAFSAQLE